MVLFSRDQKAGIIGHLGGRKRKDRNLEMTLRTINLGTMTGKVANRIERHKVDILCVQETR